MKSNFYFNVTWKIDGKYFMPDACHRLNSRNLLNKNLNFSRLFHKNKSSSKLSDPGNDRHSKCLRKNFKHKLFKTAILGILNLGYTSFISTQNKPIFVFLFTKIKIKINWYCERLNSRQNKKIWVLHLLNIK